MNISEAKKAARRIFEVATITPMYGLSPADEANAAHEIQMAIDAETAKLREAIQYHYKNFGYEKPHYLREELEKYFGKFEHMDEKARLSAEVGANKHWRDTVDRVVGEYGELEAERDRLKDQIENRTVLESYLPIFKKLAGTGYDIATSGFCEDVCNKLKQHSDNAELVEALKKARGLFGKPDAPMQKFPNWAQAILVIDAALKKAGAE